MFYCYTQLQTRLYSFTYFHINDRIMMQNVKAESNFGYIEVDNDYLGR